MSGSRRGWRDFRKRGPLRSEAEIHPVTLRLRCASIAAEAQGKEIGQLPASSIIHPVRFY